MKHLPPPALAVAPVLKWAGGKRRLLEQFRAHFPNQFGDYHEPFVGGGAVFFWLHKRGLLLDKAVFLNDINPELVNLYSVLRSDCERLIEELTKHKKLHGEEYYYQVRAQKLRSPLKRAARLVYLNRTCFNGLYRVNSKGEFNVPMGRYKDPNICEEEKLRAAALALNGVHLSEGSYLSCVERAKPGDLVYFDPPYIPLNATAYFTSYTKENFSLRDQEQLAETFAQLARRGVKVLLSNSDTSEVRNLYKEFEQVQIYVSRAINSKADGRRKISELLIKSS